MRRMPGAIALVSALAAAQMLIGAGPSQALPPNGCPYPPNNPILSGRISVRFGLVTAGTKFKIGGYLTQNLCGIGFRKVGLFTRERPGPYTYYKETLTGFNGQYGFDFATDETLDLIVVFSGDKLFPRVVSDKMHVTVVPAS